MKEPSWLPVPEARGVRAQWERRAGGTATGTGR
jgi:hypothetical protein